MTLVMCGEVGLDPMLITARINPNWTVSSSTDRLTDRLSKISWSSIYWIYWQCSKIIKSNHPNGLRERS